MIIPDLTFKEYCADDESVNNSTLKEFVACPAKYKWRLDHPREDSAAFATGRLWHTAILEPDKVADEYAVLDVATRDRLLYEARAGGSKAAEFSKRLASYKLWSESQGDREIIDEADLSAAMEARELLYKGRFKDALDHGMAEASFFNEYQTEHGPIKIKGRMDLWDDGAAMCWDLKTTRSAQPAEFGRLAWSYGYVRQAGFYRLLAELEGKEFLGFHIVAVETEPPFLHSVLTVPPQATRWGCEEAKAALSRLAYCRKTGEWPGYGSGMLELPAFASKEIEEDLQSCPGSIPDAF